MGEIKTDPIFINYVEEDETKTLVCFDDDHTLSDIARYFVNENRVDAEELVRLITEMLDG